MASCCSSIILATKWVNKIIHTAPLVTRENQRHWSLPRVPTVLVTATAVTNHIHSMIAASILQYMFITETRCEEIATKLFKHFLQLFTRDVPYTNTSYCKIFWRLCPHHCVYRLHHCPANSTTLQDLALRFPGLSRTLRLPEILQTQSQHLSGGVGTLFAVTGYWKLLGKDVNKVSPKIAESAR